MDTDSEVQFQVDGRYKRADVWAKFGKSEVESKGGPYATGYHWIGSCLVIFANIKIPGKTGHDYPNEFVGANLVWWSKYHRKISNPEIAKISNEENNIHVFYRSVKNDLWTYWGNCRLAEPMENLQVEKNEGKGDFVPCVKALLTPKNSEGQSSHPDAFAIHESELYHLSLEKLKILAAQAQESPKKSIKTASAFARSPVISALAKKLAEGKCGLCSNNAPFQTKRGIPFLECHHIIWLAKGGRDKIENTVALCPNCHRKMHHAPSKADIDELTQYIQKRDESASNSALSPCTQSLSQEPEKAHV